MQNHVLNHLEQEALGLKARLRSVLPLALNMPHVPAAAMSKQADASVRQFLDHGKRQLDADINTFLNYLCACKTRAEPAAEAQRRLTMLRLNVAATLSRFDLFADVVTQRSEHGVGVWLAGLEVTATAALDLGAFYAPPVVCYLDRGAGAAIRRARTRLPGGELNPVALVRVPRERMIGSGVGSSLVHEVGHQGSALLELKTSLLATLTGFESRAWSMWRLWLNEILADFWAIARIGPAALLGMITVLSVPSAFVFRISPDDPHPFPWIRMRLACAIAQELIPHPQWAKIDSLWRTLYPAKNLSPDHRQLMRDLSRTMKPFARLVAEHRPSKLGGSDLRNALLTERMQPIQLRQSFERCRGSRVAALVADPCRALAVLGQAKLDGRLDALQESRLLEHLFTHWALQRAQSNSESHGNHAN